MRYLLAALVLLPPVLLALGAITGRSRTKTCCPADPSKDRRMTC